MRVHSNNGTVHEATRMTKHKVHPGYVRKVCDGQWVSDTKRVIAEVNCRACKKLQGGQK